MEGVIDSVGFDGDIAAFNTYLRTDPQFYYDTPEALLEGYQAVSKRLDPGLVKLFGKLPRAPYGVRPIPDEEAPDTTTAYYCALQSMAQDRGGITLISTSQRSVPNLRWKYLACMRAYRGITCKSLWHRK